MIALVTDPASIGWQAAEPIVSFVLVVAVFLMGLGLLGRM